MFMLHATGKLNVLIPLCALTAVVLTAAAADPLDDVEPGIQVQRDAELPRVWIFAGLPGADEHLFRFSSAVSRLTAAFDQRFGIDSGRIRGLFGKDGWRQQPSCSTANLLAELREVRSWQELGGSAWLIFIGHADATETGVCFNIPGVDVTGRDIGAALSHRESAGRLVIILAQAGAGRFLQPLAGSNRILLSATKPDGLVNGSEMPMALAEALESPDSDRDGDGFVSVLEMYEATDAHLAAWYRENEYIQTEFPLLDGNGDGVATAQPTGGERQPAARCGLRLRLRP